MKTRSLLGWIVNYFIDKSLSVMITLTGYLPLKWIMFLLYLYGYLFSAHFRKQFLSDSAKFHATEYCQVTDSSFVYQHIRAQVFSQYLRRYLYTYPKGKCERFVDKIMACSVGKSEEIPTKIYLCTHSGDYWLSILNIAYQHRDNPSNIKRLVVPIYEVITEESSAVFSKIEIPDFEVIFINIHEAGALKKITAYLRDETSVVAIFYDLFCYAAGISNGAVESVDFFNRSAYMTTGFSSLIVRLSLPTKFVSTYYCHQNNRFITSLSSTKIYEDVSGLRKNMIDHIESYIRDYPAQWHFIAYLDTYYHYPFLRLQSIQKNRLESYLRLQHKYIS